MTQKCSKRAIALTWAFLECMFFSSVILGWTWLSIVFRNDGYFPDYCNRSTGSLVDAPSTHSPVMPRIVFLSTTARPCRKARGVVSCGNATSGCQPKRSRSPWHGSFDGRDGDSDLGWVDMAEAHALERFKRRQPLNISSITSPVSVTISTGGDDEDDHTGGHDPERDDAMRYCREKMRVMFALVFILRDVMTFPLGYVFDKYGTTRTRLLTVLTFVLGTLMMTFTSGDFPWLIVPALALTGIAGSGVLLTNLQTANLFGRKRHVVVSLYVGAAYSNGVIAWMMKLSHFIGVNVQTSFMFLTIGIVPMLVSTVAFLPKTRIPWPLPADYGKRRNLSLDETLLRKKRAWQRRMSEDLDPDLEPQLFPDSSHLTDYDSTEAGMVRCRRPPPSFTHSAVQPLFVWSLLWFGAHKLHEAVFETGVVEVADLEIMGPLDYETYYGAVQLLGIVCSPMVGVLIDRHFPRELATSQATQQMQKIIPAILVTSVLAVSEIAIDMFQGAAPKAIATLFNILHKVFTHTTMCAFVMHVHFNHQHFGKYYGLTCAVSAVFSAFQFPIWKFLIQKYSSMFPVHILLLLLSTITFGHGYNVWDHCRKRLIRDQSDQSSERGGFAGGGGGGTGRSAQNHQPPSFHIETDSSNLPETKEAVKVVFNDDGTIRSQLTYQNEGSMELSEVTTRADTRNGGAHIAPVHKTEADKDGGKYNDPDVDDDEEEEEEGEEAGITVMDFISL